MNILAHVKIGDIMDRTMSLGGPVMSLKVTEITNDRIICGDWEFDPRTGAEIDDDLGWGAPPKMTGSFLSGVLEENEVN